MARYRALIISGTGGILRARQIQAANDADAIKTARRYREPLLALELWRGDTLVLEIRSDEPDGKDQT